MKDVRKFVSVMSAIFSYLEENPKVLEEIMAKITQKKSPRRSSESEKEGGSMDLYRFYQEKGENGLKEYLQGLEIEDLKSIVKRYRLDPKGNYRKWKTKERFITRIVEAIKIKFEKGEVFLEQKQDRGVL